MSRKFRLAYFAHSLRSDWNHGNAHFLRGLMRNMIALGHEVSVFEPRSGWSIQHLREEETGSYALRQFSETYPELRISLYDADAVCDTGLWRDALKDFEIVVLHEWNAPALAHTLIDVRDELGFRLLFHDTHHRASSSPEQIRLFGTDQFDGVLAFGDALRSIYQQQFGMSRVWTLHEAADTSVFRPRPHTEKTTDVVWIGNWGDDERSQEICQFLLRPAASLRDYRFAVFGVRYPENALRALQHSGVRYGGYLPNLDAPAVYSAARLTVHIPRQEYVTAMRGIPTIRVFEALACGIPLISAPWEDSEQLFRKEDFRLVRDGHEMQCAMNSLLSNKSAATEQALRGLETILARHTCRHRAEELTAICEEIVQ